MLYARNVYQQGMWPRVNAYYLKTYLGFDMPVHIHENTEVMYVFSGSCEVYVRPPGEPILTARMQAGDFIFINQNVPHRLSVQPGMPCTMLNVEFTLIPSDGMFTLSGLLNESEDYARFVSLRADCCRGSDSRSELLRAMDALVNGVDRANERAAAYRAEMALFLIQLSRTILESRRKPGSTEYVRRAAAMIQQHYGKALSVERIAVEVGISAGHLSRLFRAEMGQTVSRYIEDVRIEHGTMLLERSRMSVSDIALQIGLGTRQRFDQAFKRRYGLSPREYRIKHRSKHYPQLQGNNGNYSSAVVSEK